MTATRRPAEPVVDDKGRRLGTFAELARQINEQFPPQSRRRPVSRQLVHKWWRYRAHNSFPEHVRRVGSGDGNAMFLIDDVIKWYKIHRGYRIDATAPQTSAIGSTARQEGSGTDALAA